MGNFNSCFCPNDQTATLIDIQGNQRVVNVPITAAEIMILEQPGHLISPVVDDIRSNFRLSALRADEILTSGKLYLLIPIARLNSFVKDSELEILRSCCTSVKRVKRFGNSKVLPAVGEGFGDSLGMVEKGLIIGQRTSSSPMWKPVLEPIYE